MAHATYTAVSLELSPEESTRLRQYLEVALADDDVTEGCASRGYGRICADVAREVRHALDQPTLDDTAE